VVKKLSFFLRKSSWNGQVFPTNGYLVASSPYATNGTHWGFPTLNANPSTQPGSWCYAVLAFVEQQNAHDAITSNVQAAVSAPVKIYMCPSRGRANPQTCPSVDPGPYCPGWTYSTNGLNPWGKSDYAANSSIVGAPYRNGPYLPSDLLGLSDFRNGTSNTILVGEKSLDPPIYNTGAWAFDEPYLLGGTGSVSRFATTILQDRPGVFYQGMGATWGAAHPGVGQFVFADGHVHAISTSVSGTVMSLLLDPHNTIPIPESDY
jgi:prepilin-type processing-associated H-X9-DG protein